MKPLKSIYEDIIKKHDFSINFIDNKKNFAKDFYDNNAILQTIKYTDSAIKYEKMSASHIMIIQKELSSMLSSPMEIFEKHNDVFYDSLKKHCYIDETQVAATAYKSIRKYKKDSEYITAEKEIHPNWQFYKCVFQMTKSEVYSIILLTFLWELVRKILITSNQERLKNKVYHLINESFIPDWFCAILSNKLSIPITPHNTRTPLFFPEINPLYFEPEFTNNSTKAEIILCFDIKSPIKEKPNIFKSIKFEKI